MMLRLGVKQRERVKNDGVRLVTGTRHEIIPRFIEWAMLNTKHTSTPQNWTWTVTCRLPIYYSPFKLRLSSTPSSTAIWVVVYIFQETFIYSKSTNQVRSEGFITSLWQEIPPVALELQFAIVLCVPVWKLCSIKLWSNGHWKTWGQREQQKQWN